MIDIDLELLRAIEKGRIDHEVARRADEMLRLSIILLRRLGGQTVITIDELMSETGDVDLVFTGSGTTDPLAGHRVGLVPTIRKPRNAQNSAQEETNG